MSSKHTKKTTIYKEDVPKLRPCSKCDETDKSKFYKNENLSEGLSNWCKKCTIRIHTKKKRKRKAEDPDFARRLREADARYRVKNREKALAYQRAKKLADPIKYAADKRRNTLRREYGITVEQYDAMFAKQNGACAICGHKPTGGLDDGWLSKLNVDHCHATKKVRGILCKACNLGLGYFKDKPELLLAAATYLQKK